MNFSFTLFSANAVEVVDVAPYLHFRPVTDYLNIVSNSDCKYFGFYDYSKHSSLDVYYSNTQFLYIPDDSSIVSSYIDDTTNTYHLELSTDSMLYYCNYSNTCKNDEWSYSSGATFGTSNTRSKSVRYIEYDMTERLIKAYDNNHTVVYTSYILFGDVESNLPNVPSSGLNLSVSFTPNLNGSVVRTLKQNGVENAESNYFSMDIINSSTNGCQFFMAITNSTSEINFKTLSNNGKVFNGSCGDFCFISPEWFYCLPTGAPESKVYGNSSFHYISSNSSYHRDFSWSQLDLKRDTFYNVLVYAVPNDFGCVSVIDNGLSSSSGTHSIDFDSIECVYRSSFTVLNPATYNPDDNSFGNVPNNTNSDYSSLFRYFDGYEDENGNVNIGDYDSLNTDGAFGSVPGGSHGGSGIFRGSPYTFTSFLDSAQSYLGFLNSVFNFFPTFIWGTISIGIFTIIIVGVIKRLG